MTFGSLDECLAYIRNASEDCMQPLADRIKQIMDETTLAQVRGWSGQIFNSVVAESGGNTASASFEDNGHWTSLLSGESVGNPIKFLEAGTTWNRGASNIMDTASSRCESEIPNEYKSLMQGKGIPIE